MSVIVTRAVVTVVTIEAESIDAAHDALADLSVRILFSLPKLRFGDVRIHRKQATVHPVSEKGIIRGVLPQSAVVDA